MTLDEYLVTEDINSKQFARRVRVSTSAVKKWRQRQRRPHEETVIKIFKITRGKVKPQDWYNGR